MKMNLMILMLIGFLMGNVVGVYGITVNEVAISDINNMDIEEIVTLLNSPDWRIQEVVIGKIEYGTPTLLNNERIKLAIIKILEVINANSEKLGSRFEEYLQRTGQEPPPDWKPEGVIRGNGEFQLYVRRIVEEFKDERAIPALVGSIECGGYRGYRQIAEFGTLAISPLLERLEKTKKYAAPSCIIKALQEIAKRANIIPQTVEGTPTTKAPFKIPTISQTALIKEAFIKSLNNSSEFARMEAIRGLAIIGDTSVIPLLKPIAENDPCAWNTVSGDPSKFKYPVREEAQRVIKLLEEKKKEEQKSQEIKEQKD